MIPAGSLTEVISIVDSTETGPPDDYGNPTMVDSASADFPASVTPLDATEEEILRDTRIQRYWIIVNPDATVTGFSRITWRGKNMEVLGEPKVFTTPAGVHHYEFEAREILG